MRNQIPQSNTMAEQLELPPLKRGGELVVSTLPSMKRSYKIIKTVTMKASHGIRQLQTAKQEQRRHYGVEDVGWMENDHLFLHWLKNRDVSPPKIIQTIKVNTLLLFGDEIPWESKCHDVDEEVENDDESYELCKVKRNFAVRSNELIIDNGSAEFFRVRKGKISASKLGAIAGISQYNSPWEYVTIIDARFKDTKYTIGGKREEPRTRRALILRLPSSVTIRKCGIFLHLWNCESYTAMPDDLGKNEEGEEFSLEYKYIAQPSDEETRPHPEHLAQCTWQMISIGSKTRCYLIYSLGHSHTIEGIKLACWVVEYDARFVKWLKERAALARLYIDDPCVDNIPDIPWMGGCAKILEAWVDGVAMVEGFPPPPPHYRVDVSEIGLSLKEHRNRKQQQKQQQRSSMDA